MQTMKEIGNEIWMDMGEAADYIDRTRSLLPDALRRYQEQTGHDIEKVPDGNKVYVRQKDMNELIKVLYPFLARKKGLVK